MRDELGLEERLASTDHEGVIMAFKARQAKSQKSLNQILYETGRAHARRAGLAVQVSQARRRNHDTNQDNHEARS